MSPGDATMMPNMSAHAVQLKSAFFVVGLVDVPAQHLYANVCVSIRARILASAGWLAFAFKFARLSKSDLRELHVYTTFSFDKFHCIHEKNICVEFKSI